jgi:hypothetical protein
MDASKYFDKHWLSSSKPSTDPLWPVTAEEESRGVMPPVAPVYVEGTTGGRVTMVSMADEAHAGDGAGSQRVAEPVRDVGGPIADTGQVSSPQHPH